MTTGRRGRSRARWWLAVGLAGVIAGGAVCLAATDEEDDAAPSWSLRPDDPVGTAPDHALPDDPGRMARFAGDAARRSGASGMDLLPRLRRLSEEAGTPLPVWITEYGAPTGHVRNGGEVLEVSPDEQAGWLREGIRVAARDGMSHVFAYTDSDGEAAPDAGGVVDAESRFGMVGADGVPNPSAAAFRESRCR